MSGSCAVTAMWARSGNGESIIGGKMANVPYRKNKLGSSEVLILNYFCDWESQSGTDGNFPFF